MMPSIRRCGIFASPSGTPPFFVNDDRHVGPPRAQPSPPEPCALLVPPGARSRISGAVRMGTAAPNDLAKEGPAP
eukprot:8784796-Alexandrium_andersonii.AAC.1